MRSARPARRHSSRPDPALVKHVLAVLIALAALPASAQSDLIERTIAAAHVSETIGQYFNPVMNPIDDLPETAIADSVRARLRADLRPDALREALAYLESPGARRVTARTLARPDPMQIVSLVYGDGLGEPVPKKGFIADSTLAARYLAATQRETNTLAFFRRILLAGAAVAPETLAREMRPGETLDGMVDRMIDEARASLQPILLATARLQLAGVPTVDIEDAIAAEQTDALRYVRAATGEGLARAVAPAIAAMALAEQNEAEVVPVPKPR